MLASITNLNNDAKSVRIFTDPEDAEVADQLVVTLMLAVLRQYKDQCDTHPSDFENLEDWQAALSLHCNALKEYTQIDQSSDIEEEYIIYNAKMAIVFFSDYLEEFWV